MSSGRSRAWGGAGVAAALTLAVALVGGACGRGRVSRSDRVDDRLVADVTVRLSAVRGLAVRRSVAVRVLDPDEVAARVGDELADNVSAPDRNRIDVVFAQVGLISPGTRLGTATKRLLSSQLAAFYDPRRQELVIARGALAAGGPLAALTGRDTVGKLVLAHELTHALQDQHWGVLPAPRPATDLHTDRVLARRALLEGDATWASVATAVDPTLDDSTRARILAQLERIPGLLATALPDVPALLRDTLAFQYEDGTVFVDRLLARGGWPAVDRAQADPPESSEQVLHPERYLAATRDRPTPIAIGGVGELARLGYAPVLGDTLGELVVRILLERSLPAARAATVAAGWDGDRLMAFTRGTTSLVAWITAWDTPGDATEFADAIRTAEPAARVDRRGTRVLVLLGGWPPELPARLWS